MVIKARPRHGTTLPAESWSWVASRTDAAGVEEPTPEPEDGLVELLRRLAGGPKGSAVPVGGPIVIAFSYTEVTTRLRLAAAWAMNLPTDAFVI